jgi:hypothetical protein
MAVFDCGWCCVLYGAEIHLLVHYRQHLVHSAEILTGALGVGPGLSQYVKMRSELAPLFCGLSQAGAHVGGGLIK